MHLLCGNKFRFLSNFPKHGKRESNKREVRLEDEFRNTFKLFEKKCLRNRSIVLEEIEKIV